MEKTEDSVIIDYPPSTLGFIPDFERLGPDDFVFKFPSKYLYKTVGGFCCEQKNVSFHISRNIFATSILTCYGDI
jgi:hypothetical protein